MMKAIPLYLLLFFILNGFSSAGQETIIKIKFNLPEPVSEASGIILFNGHLVIHNDSGNTPCLYEMDTLTGELVRTIDIINATNTDCEDITQDESYI